MDLEILGKQNWWSTIPVEPILVGVPPPGLGVGNGVEGSGENVEHLGPKPLLIDVSGPFLLQLRNISQVQEKPTWVTLLLVGRQRFCALVWGIIERKVF